MSKCNSNKFLTPQQLQTQKDYADKVKNIVLNKYKNPKAFVRTFGCQQNVADSQKIKGMLSTMGYSFTETNDDADLIIFNTCAVREHAEDRVFGNVGALKPYKNKRPDAVVALCGCMMQQQHVADKIKSSYPHVDLVFGTHAIHQLPQLLYKTLCENSRIFETDEIDGIIAEGLPTVYDGSYRGWLPIMYGCNNFCTYCIVPYVRGRERSRNPDDIINDLKKMVESGIKEITLLGQNVNSYNGGISFAQLLRRANEVPGEFVIRFMTSHPKDCTDELLLAMSECEKVEKHLHLPVQSGSNRILKLMNRKYTREKYLELISKAKKLMPEIKLTSDIIVGFPGETYEDFLETIDLIKKVEYQSLYTFIYSKRKGTPAEKYEDNISREEKGQWFTQLCEQQQKISAKISQQQVGKTFRVLIEEESKTPGLLNARTNCNQIVELEGDLSLIGTFQNVEITKATTWSLKGKII